MFMKKLTRLAAPAALLLALTACSGVSASAGGSDKLKVMLSYHQSIYWLPLLIAEDRGYFEDEGVEIDLQETEGSGFVTQQLIAGNAPAGWAGASDDAIAFTKDDSLRTLMCNPPQNIFRIVVPADSDVLSVKDLEGRVLGITEAGGGEEPVVQAALADAGLNRGQDIEVLPIGGAGPTSLNAILDGTVDAYATSYPDISTLTADGRLTVRDITPEEYNAIPGDCLVVKESSLEDAETRTQLVGMARAWAKGAVFAAANPEAAKTIACRMVPEECKDMAFAERYVQDTINLSGVNDGPVPFGAVPISAWETTFNVLLDSGSIEGDFDPAELAGGDLVTSFVDDYSDFDVAKVKAEAVAYVNQ
jgi:NitT/TauT family transport system substrate-binding protein